MSCGLYSERNGRDVAYMVQVGDPAQLVVVDIQTEGDDTGDRSAGATGAWGWP